MPGRWHQSAIMLPRPMGSETQLTLDWNATGTRRPKRY